MGSESAVAHAGSSTRSSTCSPERCSFDRVQRRLRAGVPDSPRSMDSATHCDRRSPGGTAEDGPGSGIRARCIRSTRWQRQPAQRLGAGAASGPLAQRCDSGFRYPQGHEESAAEQSGAHAEPSGRRHRPTVVIYAVVHDAFSPDFALGDAFETFVRTRVERRGCRPAGQMRRSR